MFASNVVTGITIAWLAPFWWALGLLVMACLGDLSPRLQPDVSGLFDRMERGGRASRNERETSHAAAA